MAETLPLFPLGTVLLPGVSLPLHIFEPRYRQLTVDLVTGAVPDKQFGVVAVRDGWVPDDDGLRSLHPVGCTAEVRDVRRLPDGRFDIVTRGARRFACRHGHQLQPTLCSVEYLPDAEAPRRQTLMLTSPPALRTAGYCSTRGRRTGPAPEPTWSPAPGPLLAPKTAADRRPQHCRAGQPTDRLR